MQNGIIKKLKERNVEIHVRSIFLQGLYNQSVDKFPSNFSSEFIEHHKFCLKSLEKIDLTLSKLSLIFLSRLRNIDAIIVGCSSVKRLEYFNISWRQAMESNIKIDFKDFSWNNSETELDPRKWI